MVQGFYGFQGLGVWAFGCLGSRAFRGLGVEGLAFLSIGFRLLLLLLLLLLLWLGDR